MGIHLKITNSPIIEMKIKRSKYAFNEPKGGFDSRLVRYEDIHSITDTDFDELVKIIDAKQGDTILDAGCGYGAVTREILKRFDSFTIVLNKDLKPCVVIRPA